MTRRRTLRSESDSEDYYTGDSSGSETEDDDEVYEADDEGVSNLSRALILSLNTCYHVGLQNEKMRRSYLDGIAPLFKSRHITSSYMDKEINVCYEVFLDEIQLPNAIARNQVTTWLILKA